MSLPTDPAPVRIGCSGWNYKHWRGLFYPEELPVKRWFEHYANEFSTVEINASFYRQPRPETYDAWKAQAPDAFRYAVKANKYITQSRKLKDCAEPLERVLTPMRRLGETLGPVLYQLPPRFRINLDRLESFLKLLPPDLGHVFEFRDKSWYTDETFALIERHRASLCIHDMPGSESPRRAIGPVAYVRMHGGEGKYWGRYSEEGLLAWTDWMVGEVRSGRPVWVFFNNDAEAHAIDDARTLKAMVRQALG